MGEGVGPLRRNVKRFRGGLVFKAHRLVYHSTLGSRVIKEGSVGKTGIDGEAVESFGQEREFFIDNLLARVHFIVVMIRWTSLASWEFEFPFPGSLTSTFL